MHNNEAEMANAFKNDQQESISMDESLHELLPNVPRA